MASAAGGAAPPGSSLAIDELEKHVQKKYEIQTKLGKGVSVAASCA